MGPVFLWDLAIPTTFNWPFTKERFLRHNAAKSVQKRLLRVCSFGLFTNVWPCRHVFVQCRFFGSGSLGACTVRRLSNRHVCAERSECRGSRVMRSAHVADNKLQSYYRHAYLANGDSVDFVFVNWNSAVQFSIYCTAFRTCRAIGKPFVKFESDVCSDAIRV